MLIPILNDYYDSGYLPRPRDAALMPFFPNCNLAVRRAAYARAGGYDPAMRAGEDADLCRRVATAGYDLYYQPNAVVHHEPRRGLRGLLRQWWGYGYGGSVHFHKARSHRLEVYATLAARPRIHRHRRLVAFGRFPVSGIVFVTYFPLLLFVLLGSAVALLAGSTLVAAVLALAAVIGFAAVVARRTPGQGIRARIAHALLVLIVNTTCCAGCLASSIRHRRIFLYPGI
jgi:cellulose synthase/poly-beta-1,6-N-acetylglucosamine synthase-like glycosyltransferase